MFVWNNFYKGEFLVLTPEAIRNVEFSRGRGYRADEVDDFIDACTETVEQLLQEKEELNQKMKVLAEKLVEYRNDEDSIRSALLSAQRAGDATLREAEEKAAALREQAEREAQELRAALLQKIEEEKSELARVQREVSDFKEKMLTLYKQHLKVIEMLPEQEKEEPVAAEPVQPVAEEAPQVVVPTDDDEVKPVSEEELKPVSRFTDLKFGNDYDISADEDDEEEPKSRGLLKKRRG